MTGTGSSPSQFTLDLSFERVTKPNQNARGRISDLLLFYYDGLQSISQMSEFEFNEDRNDFEVLEDFVFDGGNNNNSKRIVKEANEAPILKKKTKRRGAEAMYTPIVTSKQNQN